MLKLGDRNQQVSELQKLLALCKYDVIIDGDFGKNTDIAIRDFQTKNGLVVDGEVGPKTLALLTEKSKKVETRKTEAAPVSYGELKIITDVKQPDAQYIKQVSSKTQFFLHFTAGGPSAKNTIAGWNADVTTVSTAFVLDGGPAADVYECFNPKYWSFHLGIKGTNGRLDKTSIGLEICNWGPITEKNGKFYNYVNREIDASEVLTLDAPFRGFKYFHKISDVQIAATEKLMLKILPEFGIPIQKNFDMSWFEYNQELIDKTLPGVWTHVNVRKDKTDLCPDQRILDMLNRVSKAING